MSYLGWINVILIVIGVGISVTPTYKAYRYNLWQKFGYWNVLVLPILMLVANTQTARAAPARPRAPNNQ